MNGNRHRDNFTLAGAFDVYFALGLASLNQPFCSSAHNAPHNGCERYNRLLQNSVVIAFAYVTGKEAHVQPIT